MRHALAPLIALVLVCAASLFQPARAQDFDSLVNALPEGNYTDRGETAAAIAATGDERAVAVLTALLNGDLEQMKADGRIVIMSKRGRDAIATDALTGEEIGTVTSRDTERIRVNNGLRRDLRAAIGVLSLTNPDPEKRRAAAEAGFRSPDAEQIPALEQALARETDGSVRAVMEQALAAAMLMSDRPVEQRLGAIDVLADRGDREAQSILTRYASDPDLGAAAQAAIDEIARVQRLWGIGQDVWYGLSLGSVLLLAAIGLAITFGVMGVINMAHGELVMLGAYTTFVVQEVIRTHLPGLFDWSLLIAAPLAFLVAGAVGVAIERGIVRFLYGRPLETLLATWGVSLILQQAVRTLFGPNNREVGNPEFMSGAFQVGAMTVTWNRMWIIVFALVVFGALMALLKRTPMGLQMRAVTQNRAMAANMGIRTGWVDAMTFGLGAGVAGLAGVALSQIDNVSPNLGQSYIVDSFMVVVFGGAGNLWGALAGAFTLGVVNKFLEPFTGAVLGKIIVLVAIILFIQKRPRGLFALRGRSVEG
ncbi:urea ABC transporter permease subunit UrtB [Paroceanicella profunda]|uniref:Urea ABC transporter permease subunit UrtB n=1 Tax=Paroceanicella profunda TaxID=2579971 RepID=A0A5B8G292_9RHOB|nr:urea ABC transporter permease subunit UrtB [Paroceanicella profunda]QDL93429.1 urea ABC transporter permease subunit UrtB [Paroceanicella profunda]